MTATAQLRGVRSAKRLSVTITKILVAHDFSEPSNRALAFAAGLAGATGATLELVHVMPDLNDGQAELSLPITTTLPGQGERYTKFLETELERVVQTVTPELVGKVACHAVRGDAVKRIEALAQEHGADMVCLGATGKGAVARVLLGSVSQLVLRTSKLPVLLVP